MMDYAPVNVAVVAGTHLSSGTLYGPLKEFEFTPIWSSAGFQGQNGEIIEVTQTIFFNLSSFFSSLDFSLPRLSYHLLNPFPNDKF